MAYQIISIGQPHFIGSMCPYYRAVHSFIRQIIEHGYRIEHRSTLWLTSCKTKHSSRECGAKFHIYKCISIACVLISAEAMDQFQRQFGSYTSYKMAQAFTAGFLLLQTSGLEGHGGV